MAAARRETPTRDMDAPTRPKLRTESELPIKVAEKTEKVAPSLAIPNNDIEEPKRAKLRRDKELP
jgi:hypothetical protein